MSLKPEAETPLPGNAGVVGWSVRGTPQGRGGAGPEGAGRGGAARGGVFTPGGTRGTTLNYSVCVYIVRVCVWSPMCVAGEATQLIRDVSSRSNY